MIPEPSLECRVDLLTRRVEKLERANQPSIPTLAQVLEANRMQMLAGTHWEDAESKDEARLANWKAQAGEVL